MSFPLFLEKHVVEDEYTNRLYKPFHFLIVVFGSVNTQGPFIAMLAEFERNLISERTKAGLEAARARGRTGGRPPTLATSKKVQLARQLFADKTNTIKDICKTLTISKSTFYRYVGMQTRSEKEQAAVDQ